MTISVLLLSTALLLPAPDNSQAAITGEGCQARPLVIAHRGASGYLPEHSLAAYQKAIAQGADIIETDLVPSRDGVLIARHENELSTSTDVASRPEFAGRKTRKQIDGIWQQGWFSEDFSLAELRTLRLKETLPALRPGSAAFDGQFQIVTFAEILQLLVRENAKRQMQTGLKPIDLYIETKHPTYFANAGQTLAGQPIGLDITRLLVDTLQQSQAQLPDTVYIQSFEVSNLLQLRYQLLPALPSALQQKIKLIQLLGDTQQQYLQPKDSFSEPYDLVYLQQSAATTPTPLAELATVLPGLTKPGFHYGQLLSRSGLSAMARYADGIGPWRQSLYPQVGATIPLLQQAHAVGLQVHPYTFRQEQNYLLPDQSGQTVSMQAELAWLFRQGIDGVFADFPDIALQARTVACR
jgi:glycerophosphoryl diester phosphodiesterase